MSSREFQARVFIVARAVQIKDGRLRHGQISIFLGHKTVLTFQEAPSNEWDFIRQRINAKGSRLRSNDASFLAYALLDAIVDGCFPILDYYSERAEDLERLILEQPQPNVINEIHQFKRDLLLLRWAIWPMRDVVSTLQRDPHECVSDAARVYLGDLYDHVVRIIEITETYREIASDLTETITIISENIGSCAWQRIKRVIRFTFFGPSPFRWARKFSWKAGRAAAIGK